jgi:quercetin dioxygenase-like cupin family protein
MWLSVQETDRPIPATVRTQSDEPPKQRGWWSDMPRIDFDAQRSYDDGQFNAVGVFKTDRKKVVCGYFNPGQFIPVHAPSSDLTVVVRSGSGIIREGNNEHEVAEGDIVLVEADTDRGIKADDEDGLEALLVTSPPPTDAEHDPVREGLQAGEFDPRGEQA